MKKIVSISIVVSLALAFTALTPLLAEESTDNSGAATTTLVSGEKLEKIIAPQFISLFKNIKKIGASLWGIKKENKTETRVLEKIAAPGFISLFENIQKKGKALWGFRKKSNFVTITASASACVITAIEIKDQAIIDFNTTQNNEFVSAVNARTACQKAALATTENQQENLAKCATAFKDALKTSKQKYLEAQKTAWKTYKESLAACTKLITDTTATTTATTIDIMIEDGGDE